MNKLLWFPLAYFPWRAVGRSTDLAQGFLMAIALDAIGTANELAMAQRAHAQTVEVQASHFVMISQPEAVVSVIESAAGQR